MDERNSSDSCPDNTARRRRAQVDASNNVAIGSYLPI